jgi:uncharacterized caspase-like protein
MCFGVAATVPIADRRMARALCRRAFRVSLLLSLLFVSAATAMAADPAPGQGKRVALVIGNGSYINSGELANPKNDAADIAATLRTLGFDVFEGINLDKTGMDRTIRDFAEGMTGAQLALFFYAGHGLQVNGQNYLMPVDARLTKASGLDFEMVRLDLVQRAMEREASINIIILDACRDNPLGRSLARALGTRSSAVTSGLAPMESGEGTLIIFSTQPGNTASDGLGRNSPFSAALLKHITAPGDDLPTILINVRNDVMAATGRRQVPWEHSALTTKVYFTPPRLPPADAGPTPDQRMELAFWESVKDSANPAVLRSYLEQYPQGTFAPLARALIEQHEKQQVAEQAARQEAAKQAEAKRLDDERKAREAILADERKRADKSKNAAEAKRIADQQRQEEVKRAEELRKVLDDLRIAREAAKTAEEQRLAALKAAEEARKTAAEASKRTEGDRGPVVASLPKLEQPAPSGSFDGTWTITHVSSNCMVKGGTFAFVVAGSSVGGGKRSGRIAATGAVRWTSPARTDGHPVIWTGTFRGNSGSGTYGRQDGRCGGSFTARRS